MPIFTPDDGTVAEMIQTLQHRYEGYTEQIEARVKIDVIMVFADRDPDTNDKLNDALKKGGVRCLGLARSIGKKDRAMGRGDAEICLDGDHWETITEDERMALLDHELFHIVPKRDRDGNFKKDDLRRPLIKLRPHDQEFGWFNTIAARHGSASVEQQQAAHMMEEAGQFYWPSMLGSGAAVAREAVRRIAKTAGKGGSVTIGGDGFSHTIKGE